MKFILAQLYDVRHRTEAGELDIERMTNASGTVNLRDGEFALIPMQKRRVRVASFQAHAAAVRIHNARERMAFREALAFELNRLEPLVARESIPEKHSETFVTHTAPLVMPEDGAPQNVPGTFKLEGLRNIRIPRSFIAVILLAALVTPALSTVGSMGSVERSVLASSNEALQKLELAAAAMTSLDTAAASTAFREAEEAFHSANDQLSSVGFGFLSFMAELPLSGKLSAGKDLLQAGEHLAAAGKSLSRAFGKVDLFSADSLLDIIETSERFKISVDGGPDTVIAFEESLQAAAKHLSAAAKSLENIDVNAVPPTYRPQLERLLLQLPTIKTAATLLQNSAHDFGGMFGMHEPRHYLILLQNSSELRPTGGFVGNLAIATVTNGSLAELRVEDAYFLDGQLRHYTVPPKPIQDVSAAWSLHDANWFRDFPTTARAVSNFFEETGMTTPDGVFAVTSTAFERILTATGQIKTPDGLIVDSRSFTDTLNALGEAQRPGETTQVRAVAALLPALLQRMNDVDPTVRATLFDALKTSAAAGDIQMWFRDEGEEKLVRMIGLSGELPESQSDFVAVVEANINGFKTDKVIAETIRHDAAIDADGAITDTLTLHRTHQGNMRSESFYRKVNKTYLRVLVPKGSELLSSEGFTCDPYTPLIDYTKAGYAVSLPVSAIETSTRPEGCVDVGEESGRTFFGGWTFVSPGETLNIRLTYRLPVRISGSVDSYRLVVAKQPGRDAALYKSVHVDSSWQVAWHDERLQEQEANTFASIVHPLAYNELFGIVLKQE